MKKYSDFNTIEELHSFTDYIIKDASLLRSYLTLKNKWRNIVDITKDTTHPLFDAAEGIYQFAKEGKPLSFKPDTLTGMAHRKLLSEFVDLALIDTSEEILELCNKPYKNVSQEEFDADKATGETEATSVTYEGQDVVHLVNVGKKLLNFVVKLGEPAAYDCTVTVTASGKRSVDETDYLPLARPFPVPIKAGQVGIISLDQAAAYFPRHVQFTATIDKANTPFSLDVITN